MNDAELASFLLDQVDLLIGASSNYVFSHRETLRRMVAGDAL